MYPIITVSREFGSGGHSVGKKVAELLELPFYDAEIVAQAAKETGFDERIITEQGEYSSRANKWFGNWTLNTTAYYEDPQDQLFRIQSNIIRNYAEQGPCVIVGRCADYILKESGFLTLNVFIHSDMKHRAERVLARYGESEVNIQKRLEKKDRNRKTYYKYYTDQVWGDYHNYSLSLDSGLLGIDLCADIIVSAAKQMDNIEL